MKKLEELSLEERQKLPFRSPILSEYAQRMEQKYSVPQGILRAILVDGEKSNNNQVSPKGAAGHMQWMPNTAKEYGVNPLDPVSSIERAGKYIANAMRVTGSSDPAILGAAYNGGMFRDSLKQGIIPNIKETQNYARRVADGVARIASGEPIMAAQQKQPSSTFADIDLDKMRDLSPGISDAIIGAEAPKDQASSIAEFLAFGTPFERSEDPQTISSQNDMAAMMQSQRNAEMVAENAQKEYDMIQRQNMQIALESDEKMRKLLNDAWSA